MGQKMRSSISMFTGIPDKEYIALRNKFFMSSLQGRQPTAATQQLTTVKGFYDFRYSLFGGVKKKFSSITLYSM
jgi:hypothetical protein